MLISKIREVIRIAPCRFACDGYFVSVAEPVLFVRRKFKIIRIISIIFVINLSIRCSSVKGDLQIIKRVEALDCFKA